MNHPTGQQYMIAATTQEVKTTGHLRITVVTLGHEVMALDDTVRVDLADHPLYKELQQYVLANPR